MAYIIEAAVEGSSLHEVNTFDTFSKVISDIIFEIDSLPELNLPRTERHLDVMKDVESRKKCEKELADAHKAWLEGASLKFNQMYAQSIELLNTLCENNKLELGTVHGEFNYHHILFDGDSNVWIIDWERASQAYPRFFDLAEYLGRLIVTVENGKELVFSVLKDFNDRNVEYSRQTLLFGIYNRILGTLWEVSQWEKAVLIGVGDEDEILSKLKSSLDG